MRDHNRSSVIASLVAGAALVACVGGGGNLPDGMTTLDPASSSLEGTGIERDRAPDLLETAPSSQDRVGTSSESAPGAPGGGPGAFDCSGTFTCRQEGESGSERLRLRRVNGVCTVRGSGSVSIVLGNDGSVTVNGTSVGTWSTSGSGFTATTSEGAIRCTRRASDDDGDEGDEGDDRSPPSSGSAGGGANSGSPGIPPIDAGVPSAPPDDD